jgi:signal transduction histidine kinase
MPSELDLDVMEECRRLLAQAVEIGAEIHRMSHELHPVTLEYAGLGASLRDFCDELVTVRHVAVDVDIADLPRTLAPDVALCLYRIAQEAVHNALKHSGTRRVAVTLAVTAQEVVLRVTDNGRGFDHPTTLGRDTLGLVSMRERARFVDGELVVTSTPGRGTRVEASVPVKWGPPATNAF